MFEDNFEGVSYVMFVVENLILIIKAQEKHKIYYFQLLFTNIHLIKVYYEESTRRVPHGDIKT